MIDFAAALTQVRKDADIADVHIAGDTKARRKPKRAPYGTLKPPTQKTKDWRQRQHPASGQFTSAFELAKVDAPEGLVFGWASVVEEAGEIVTDTQGDTIHSDEMEKAAYDFVLNARAAGDMHVRKDGVGRLVESIAFTAEKQAALGIDLGKVGHWVGFKIDDADVLEKVRSGEYGSLSIGGRGRRTPHEEE